MTIATSKGKPMFSIRYVNISIILTPFSRRYSYYIIKYSYFNNISTSIVIQLLYNNTKRSHLLANQKALEELKESKYIRFSMRIKIDGSSNYRLF